MGKSNLHKWRKGAITAGLAAAALAAAAYSHSHNAKTYEKSQSQKAAAKKQNEDWQKWGEKQRLQSTNDRAPLVTHQERVSIRSESVQKDMDAEHARMRKSMADGSSRKPSPWVVDAREKERQQAEASKKKRDDAATASAQAESARKEKRLAERSKAVDAIARFEAKNQSAREKPVENHF